MTKPLKKSDQGKAIERAARLEKSRQDSGTTPSKANPCTLVYQLVEALAQFKDHPSPG